MKHLSPGKLNLRLKITGIRKDGYHLLDSLFIPVSLCDEIYIEENLESKNDTVEFIFPQIKKPKRINNNTVEKSLKMLRGLNNHLPYFKISIFKNIPIGAGMGGGSSNAGTVINVITQKYLKKMTTQDKITHAAHIGADVPFFINARPTRVEGIGEILSPIELKEELSFVIIKPPFEVSSKTAYKWYDAQTKLTHNATDVNPSLNVLKGCAFDLSSLLPIMENDLEKSVIKHNPEIDILKDELVKSGAIKSLMTGSGSAVFGIYKNSTSAEKACKLLKKQLPKTYTVYLVSNI